MSIAVVLAIGMDSWVLEAQRKAWRSAGYFVTSAGSIGEAIDDFQGGDFDLVLMSHSIPAQSRERLASLIRASGSRVPVVCVANSAGEGDTFADATIKNEPSNLLQSIKELLSGIAKKPAVGTIMLSDRLLQA
jgi:CheY-like chemotaxis protein